MYKIQPGGQLWPTFIFPLVRRTESFQSVHHLLFFVFFQFTIKPGRAKVNKLNIKIKLNDPCFRNLKLTCATFIS